MLFSNTVLKAAAVEYVASCHCDNSMQCELLQGRGEKGGLLCCILIRAWASPPSEEVFVLTPAI